MRALAVLLGALLLHCAPGAHAHKASDSYLALTVLDGGIDGQWDIALRDLDLAIGLDSDGNGELTWGEIRARHRDIAAYALSRLRLSAGGAPCALNAKEHLIDHHSDGAYAVLRFAAACARSGAIDVGYHLLFDLDPQHKGLARVEHRGGTTTAIFSPEHRLQRFGTAGDDGLQAFAGYLKHGIHHIWIGFDHILFLLSLLLPAMLVPHRGQGQTTGSLRASCVDVLKIVTAFTLAHSVTLTLATLGLIALPSRWVESAIAASVAVAALNNLFPLFRNRWIAAFAFGLIHGFGFAGVLSGLGLPQTNLLLALLGFNLGVEIGQLAIVAAFLPPAYALRKTPAYRQLVLNGGSAAIALIATVWFAERMLDVRLL
jgi:hypothetical protein